MARASSPCAPKRRRSLWVSKMVFGPVPGPSMGLGTPRWNLCVLGLYGLPARGPEAVVCLSHLSNLRQSPTVQGVQCPRPRPHTAVEALEGSGCVGSGS